ncbi:hypothetical protein PGT21_015666 [Puccinia graminis f. sp. tritici]|nr:hypothetical protein PGT21_015666 [Puccinia graminis f. sp. tritici]KAA1138524.1 hypothetical protein PGTUg99_025719 [Puccinia graminis f. sp. tritici]
MKIQFLYVLLTVVAFLALVDELEAAPAPWSFKKGWDWVKRRGHEVKDDLGWH